MMEPKEKTLCSRTLRLEEVSGDQVMDRLLEMSRHWAAENSCHGYVANGPADVEGKRVFVARDGGQIVGYLFGEQVQAQRDTSVMAKGTPFFEVDELYVCPDYRSQGIGGELFRFAEQAVKGQAKFLALSTATKNREAILRFYLDRMGMVFWSARMFKPLD